MPGDPVLTLSSSTSLLSVPQIALTPFVGTDCDDISLSAISESGDGSVYWFDSVFWFIDFFLGGSPRCGQAITSRGVWMIIVSPIYIYRYGQAITYRGVKIIINNCSLQLIAHSV